MREKETFLWTSLGRYDYLIIDSTIMCLISPSNGSLKAESLAWRVVVPPTVHQRCMPLCSSPPTCLLIVVFLPLSHPRCSWESTEGRFGGRRGRCTGTNTFAPEDRKQLHFQSHCPAGVQHLSWVRWHLLPVQVSLRSLIYPHGVYYYYYYYY